MLEIQEHFGGPGTEGLGVLFQHFDRVGDTFRHLNIVVVHGDHVFGPVINQGIGIVTFLSEGHLFFDPDIADIGHLGLLDDILDGVGTVVDNDDLKPGLGVILVPNHFQEHGDEGPAVERDTEDRDKGTFEFLFGGDQGFRGGGGGDGGGH